MKKIKFSDMWSINLNDHPLSWVKIKKVGIPPSPRSGIAG